MATKKPMWRPCRIGSPQKTLSFAPSAIGFVTRHGLLRWILKRPLEPDQVAADPERRPVEHDRRDHLVGADRRLEDSGDSGPQSTRESPGAGGENDVRNVRQIRHRHSNLRCGDHPGDVLALAADVEEPAPEREGHRETDEDQRRRDDQRLLEVEGRSEPLLAANPGEEPVEAGAVEDRLVGVDRVLAGCEEDDEPSDEEGEQRCEDRCDDSACPRVEVDAGGHAGHRVGVRRRFRLGRRCGVAHDATSSILPPVIAIPSSSSLTSGPYSATICPS